MITLTLECLDALVQRGRLVPSPASPLGFLRARTATPAGRPDASASTPEAREAFDIVGQPAARLSLRLTQPGGGRLSVVMVLRGDRACLVSLGGEAVVLGSPVSVGSLVDAVVDAIGTPVSVAGETEATFSADELKVLAWLWPGMKRALDAPLTRAAALGRLAEAKTPADVAATALDDLVAAGLLEAKDPEPPMGSAGNTLIVAARYRPWLAMAWSDQLLEIEYTVLPPGEVSADLASLTRRLLFVGPPGGRALSRSARGAEGKDPMAVITLTALPREAVRRLVAGLLGLAAGVD